MQAQTDTFCAVMYFVAHSSLTLPMSSILPLQSSSLPLQVSSTVPGDTIGSQVDMPEVHCVLPLAHSPGSPVEQALSFTVPGSSSVPLQSLSLPSQISGTGVA